MAAKQQYSLDFQSKRNDLRCRLRSALKEIDRQSRSVNLEHWSFLTWVLNVTNGDAGLVKSLDHIADELWCSKKTAQRVVERLEAWQMIRVVPRKTTHDCDAPNEYLIHEPGVDHWLQLALDRMGLRRADDGQIDYRDGQNDQRASQNDHPPLLIPSSCSNTLPLPLPLAQSTTRAAAVAMGDVAMEDETAAADPRQAAAWETAIAKLRAAGLRATSHVVSKAQARGIPPSIVLQAVAFFESHAAAWERNAGAITFWLREYHAGDDPCDWRFWPTPCESYKRSRTAKAAPSQPWQGRDGQATAIVREARQRGLSDEQILAALAEKGLRWPGDNHQPKESLT